MGVGSANVSSPTEAEIIEAEIIEAVKSCLNWCLPCKPEQARVTILTVENHWRRFLLPHVGAEMPCKACHPNPSPGDVVQCNRWRLK